MRKGGGDGGSGVVCCFIWLVELHSSLDLVSDHRNTQWHNIESKN